MLAAYSDATLVESRLRTALFLEREFRVYVAWRDRLLFDTRFIPPAVNPADVMTLQLVVEGRTSVAGITRDAPVAFALSEHEFERVHPGALALRTWGDPYVGIEIRIKRGMLHPTFASGGLTHGPLSISETTWQSATNLVETITTTRPAELIIRQLLRDLAEDRVVAPGLGATILDEPPNLHRLWSALSTRYQRHATGASLLQIKRDLSLSLRQLHRDVTELTRTFDLMGDGFRATQKLLRLRSAVLWLSSPEASLAEVASHVGYGSVDAMARAFRDHAMPTPATLRDELRFPLRP